MYGLSSVSNVNDISGVKKYMALIMLVYQQCYVGSNIVILASIYIHNPSHFLLAS